MEQDAQGLFIGEQGDHIYVLGTNVQVVQDFPMTLKEIRHSFEGYSSSEEMISLTLGTEYHKDIKTTGVFTFVTPKALIRPVPSLGAKVRILVVVEEDAKPLPSYGELNGISSQTSGPFTGLRDVVNGTSPQVKAKLLTNEDLEKITGVAL